MSATMQEPAASHADTHAIMTDKDDDAKSVVSVSSDGSSDIIRSNNDTHDKRRSQERADARHALKLERQLRQVQRFKACKQVRFRASEVAALCGLDDFKDPIQLVMDHVYQYNEAQLHHDASLLGMTVENEAEQFSNIVSKTDIKTQAVLKRIREDAEKGKLEATDTAKVKKLHETVAKALSENVTLNATEKAQVSESLRSSVNTSLGIHLESAALDRYEATTGSEVVERMGQTMMLWRFPAEEKDGLSKATLEMKKMRKRGRNPEATTRDVDQSLSKSSAGPSNDGNLNPRSNNDVANLIADVITVSSCVSNDVLKVSEDVNNADVLSADVGTSNVLADVNNIHAAVENVADDVQNVHADVGNVLDGVIKANADVESVVFGTKKMESLNDTSSIAIATSSEPIISGQSLKEPNQDDRKNLPSTGNIVPCAAMDCSSDDMNIIQTESAKSVLSILAAAEAILQEASCTSSTSSRAQMLPTKTTVAVATLLSSAALQTSEAATVTTATTANMTTTPSEAATAVTAPISTMTLVVSSSKAISTTTAPTTVLSRTSPRTSPSTNSSATTLLATTITSPTSLSSARIPFSSGNVHRSHLLTPARKRVKSDHDSSPSLDAQPRTSNIDINMLADLSTSPIAPNPTSSSSSDKYTKQSHLLPEKRSELAVQDQKRKEPVQVKNLIEPAHKKQDESVYPHYMFEVAGIVDGIAEEFVFVEGSSTDGDWGLQRIVVEVKNRSHAGTMRKTPGIQEQIQLVMYLHMLGLDEGDLIQYMRKRSGGTGALLCSRVSIKAKGAAKGGDELNHVGKLESCILPRLYRFARMVMAFRDDDGLRYSFLGGDEQSRRAVVMQFCPDLLYSGSRAWTNDKTRKAK